jgi:ribonuclease D
VKDHPKSITRVDLAQLAVRSYEGPVSLVATADDLERARHELHRAHVVGIDTESPPAFRKGESHLPSLVQIATKHTVYLFQLKRMDCAEVLVELLQNPAIIKAGIGLRDDFIKLRQLFPFEETRILDLSAVARRHGMEQTGVRNLEALFLGFRISKGQSTSNWGREELTQNQIRYAATDAWVCLELYHCFQKKNLLATANQS